MANGDTQPQFDGQTPVSGYTLFQGKDGKSYYLKGENLSDDDITQRVATLRGDGGASTNGQQSSMMPGSYQTRPQGPILNVNDSTMHAGVRGVQNALGVTKPPTSLWDELSQIAGSAGKFAGNEWDALRKQTGEQGGIPVVGTPLTDALYLPHLAARGVEGLASGVEGAASDIESGIKNQDPRSAAYGVGSALGMKGQLETGEQVGKAIGGPITALRNKISAPLADTVTKPRGTIPADQYSPADLKAYADANGIPVTAAQATENVGLRALQSSGERAVVGGSAVKQGIQATQAAIATHAGNLADSMSPNTPDLASQGTAIQKGVQDALTRETSHSNLGYSAIDQMANGSSVDLSSVNQVARRILNDTDFVREAGVDPKRATAILQGVIDATQTPAKPGTPGGAGFLGSPATPAIPSKPVPVSFSEAQQLRSALLEASRTPDLAISNQAQAWIKQLTGATDSAMMAAAQSKPGLQQLFRVVNDHWTQMQEDFNSPRSVLNQILAEPDPNRVPQKVTQKGQIAGSPYNGQLFDKYGIDKGPVKAAIVEDLLNRDFRLYGKNLGGYSDNFLSSMFTPAELAEVYKTGALARSAGLNTNPSGTASVSSAIEQTINPVRALAQNRAAKLTNSPGFNARMMNTQRLPPQGATTGRLAGATAAGAGAAASQQNPPDDETTGAALYEKHGGPAIRQALNDGATQDILQTVAPNTTAFLLKRAGVADKTSFKNRSARAR